MSASKQSGRYGPRRRTTDAEIIALRERGWSTPNICRELRVGHPRVRKALAGLDIAPPTPVRRGIQRTENRLAIIRLADGTRTAGEIVAELGVSVSLVRRVAAQEGLPILAAHRGPAPTPKAPTSSKTAPSLAQPRSRPTRTESEARDAEIIARRRAGAYPRDIAAAMSLNISTVFRAIRDVADLPPLPDMRNQASPPAQYRAKVRRAEGVVMATRTCHSCAVTIPAGDWSKHLAEVHGYNGKAAQARTSLDRYLEHARQEALAEPMRQPDPPCEICGQSPCPTTMICARHARARKQHGWSGKKAA